MNVHTPKHRPRRKSVMTEEDRAWVSFYRRVGKDPMIAAEVIEQLESDAEMRREHLALYMCCKESLRLHQARAARNRRIGKFVRQWCSAIFFGLPAAMRRMAGRGSDLAVEILPEVSAEPASAKVRQLMRDPKVRRARASFDAQTSAETAVASAAAKAHPEPQVARAGG